MRKFATVAGAVVLGMGSTAHAYDVTGSIRIDFGGSTNGVSSDQGFVTSAGPLAMANPTNSTLFHTLTGANSTSTYNSTFATTADCAVGGGIVPGDASSPTARKYGCRYTSYGGTPLFGALPLAGAGPIARAEGDIHATDTTLTGTLTIIAMSDEPTGATTVINTSGGMTTRLSNSVGNGFSGYNYRTADGSPFGSAWYGVTTAGTLTLNLTGTFTDTSWEITGGTVAFSDAGFACQQGGFGGDTRGTLCSGSTTGGGFNPDGSHLSWGMDPDATGAAGVGQINVRDAAGVNTLATLSGLIASLSIDGNLNVTTNSGEFRRASGSAGGGCLDHIRYNPDTGQLVCGSLTAGNVNITGTVIPLPAAAWLLAPAVLAAGRFARRRKAA